MSVIPMKFDKILLKQASNTHFFTQKFANSDIYRTFAPLDSATLPDDQRTRADLFYFGDMSTTLS